MRRRARRRFEPVRAWPRRRQARALGWFRRGRVSASPSVAPSACATAPAMCVARGLRNGHRRGLVRGPGRRLRARQDGGARDAFPAVGTQLERPSWASWTSSGGEWRPSGAVARASASRRPAARCRDALVRQPLEREQAGARLRAERRQRDLGARVQRRLPPPITRRRHTRPCSRPRKLQRTSLRRKPCASLRTTLRSSVSSVSGIASRGREEQQPRRGWPRLPHRALYARLMPSGSHYGLYQAQLPDVGCLNPTRRRRNAMPTEHAGAADFEA